MERALPKRVFGGYVPVSGRHDRWTASEIGG
jgi:hypothetical protein